MVKITLGKFKKLSFLLLALVLGFVISINSASAASDVFITNYAGTTKTALKNEHVFYSSKDTINVKFKVEKFIQTHNSKRVYIEVQKDGLFWWSTKVKKSVTNTDKISFNVSAGSGNYKIVVYDEKEPTGWDKPPLYYEKSTTYSGSVTGID